eukprot:10502515-Ditylum_brightwellii.AAC.1
MSFARSNTISDDWLQSVGAGDEPKGIRRRATARPWMMAMQAAAMDPDDAGEGVSCAKKDDVMEAAKKAEPILAFLEFLCDATVVEGMWGVARE